MVDGIRVGDAERERANTLLLDAVGAGMIDLHEYEERSGLVWRSRTRSELDVILADLDRAPAPAPVQPAPDHPQARSTTRRRRVVAVLSSDRFAAPVGVDDAVDAYAVLGSAVVDLRREDLPDGLHVTVTAILGEVEVLLPQDAQVHLTGASVLGERSVTGAYGGGPEVHVRGIAVLGSVKVSPGDGAMLPAGPGRPGASVSPRPAGAVARRVETRASRAGRLARKVAGVAGGLLVPAAIIGGLIVAGPNGASVFGSRVVPVDQDGSVQVSVLFGSVDVVVPDDARVQTSGLVAFGSVDCDQACSPGKQGKDVTVRSIGGFGSVSIKTESEVRADNG